MGSWKQCVDHGVAALWSVDSAGELEGRTSGGGWVPHGGASAPGSGVLHWLGGTVGAVGSVGEPDGGSRWCGSDHLSVVQGWNHCGQPDGRNLNDWIVDGSRRRDVPSDSDDPVRKHLQRSGFDGDRTADGDDDRDDADIERGDRRDLVGESERDWAVHLPVAVERRAN